MADEIEANPSASSSPVRAVHYDVEALAASSSELKPSLHTRHTFQTENDGPNSNLAPILKRRATRASSSTRTFRAASAYPLRPNWQPGQEPGLDPSKPNGGREQTLLSAHCDITVVDYSEDDMVMHHLNNDTLPGWLAKESKKEDWIKCRWISVNGLSWDVIQALGKYKRLHRLAIEDMVNTRSRSKVDWYSDHTFIVLTLQKLVHLHENSDDEGSDDGESTDTGSGKAKSKRRRFKKFWRKLLSGGKSKPGSSDSMRPLGASERPQDATSDYVAAHAEGLDTRLQKLRTLQRYHAGPNLERIDFMEKHSALTKKNLAVCAEQVSIFLTSDNTVISFFEASAEDVETPILRRLSTPDTILRRYCDASMLSQAIIDAVIDLAIPVSTAYQDVIGDLELNVLTNPDISHTTDLYIVTSEIVTMRNFINPISSLVTTLREHKSPPPPVAAPNGLTRISSEIQITPATHAYLRDVEDHCLQIVAALDQMHASAAGMIDLIFNTISAYQNESMKQLTFVTIIFLPMSFLTGYFGMNLVHFPSLNNGESFFWSIAVPVAFVTAFFLTWPVLVRWSSTLLQRRGIRGMRRKRLMREAEAKSSGK